MSIENSLQDVYGKALRKAVKQYRAFLQTVEDVYSGKIKPPQFYVDTGTEDKWRKGFLTQQLRQQGLIEKMGAELDKAGGDAAEIIQDSLENTYKGSWHKQKTIFEQYGAKVGIKPTFSVLSTRAIERAVDDSQQHSPFSKISINNLGKNMAVRRRLQNEMAQSIALGESKSKLIKRLRDVAGNAMYNATRVAQTETTRIAAQARNDAAGEVVAQGARMYKKWICHIDGRERTSHHELNGMAVMYGQDFKENLAMPGDPRAPAGQVCNCRCTIVYHALLDDEQLVDGRVVKRDITSNNVGSGDNVGHSPDSYRLMIENADRTLQKIDEQYAIYSSQQFFASEERQAQLSVLMALIEERRAGIVQQQDYWRQQLRNAINADYQVEIRKQFGTIKGNHTFKQDARAVNTIVAEDKKTQRNCGHCVVALDARCRGIDVKASLGMDMSDDDIASQWVGFTFQKTSTMFKERIASEIQQQATYWGSGARGIVIVDWQGKTDAHVFSFIVKPTGVIQFADGQNKNGDTRCRQYFLKSKVSNVRFGRTDDKPLSQRALYALRGADKK